LDDVNSLFEKIEEEQKLRRFIKTAEKTYLVFGLYKIRSFFSKKMDTTSNLRR